MDMRDTITDTAMDTPMGIPILTHTARSIHTMSIITMATAMITIIPP